MTSYQLCHVDDILTAGSKAFTIQTDSLKVDLFVVSQNGRFYAYKNHCPHTGVNLNWQPDVFLDYYDEYIQCSTHGALFEIESGLCIRGPCVGAYLRSLAVKLSANYVYVML